MIAAKYCCSVAQILVSWTGTGTSLLFQTAFEPSIRYVNTIFRCRRWQGNPVIGEPTKIAELGWFAPENFPDKLTVGARVYLMSLGDRAVRNYYIGPGEYREMMGAGYEGA